MSLLLLGSKGQLGRAFCQRLSEHGFLLSTLIDINFIDATNVIGQVQRLQPKIIINAAAYTSVDQAETEPDLVFQVNSQMVAILAEAAKQVGALLVHFSTDYVFDGSGTK
ncbi:SDR family oxidoreductase [Aeromonas salmonicida]|nr:sugar nucleotide-binding protein [Aeromonas salmonicida]